MTIIKEIRTKKGLTQDKLANAAGVKQATISDIERGKIKHPGINTAAKLANALGVSIEDLFPVNKTTAA
jgi:transcriptional regulator with XRE-family HTH domain